LMEIEYRLDVSIPAALNNANYWNLVSLCLTTFR
jgi:hypothetical protein